MTLCGTKSDVLLMLHSMVFSRGVFARYDISAKDVPMVMCLYPGIYTPGLPFGVDVDAEYLANQSAPSNYCSAASTIDENAYILNLTLMGGYIDGCALSHYENDADGNNVATVLNINPSACGHLINHSAVRKNVDVLAFAWEEVTTRRREAVFGGVVKRDDNSSYYSVPNELRADGSHWYYDPCLDEVISFPSKSKGHTPLPRTILCGAAMILTASLSQGEELLLDYGLKEPCPTWAKGWYEGSSTNK